MRSLDGCKCRLMGSARPLCFISDQGLPQTLGQTVFASIAIERSEDPMFHGKRSAGLDDFRAFEHMV